MTARVHFWKPVFKQWRGTPVANRYGNKAVIDCDGEPVFAELAILRSLQKKGFDGVWVDTYGRRFCRTVSRERFALPEDINRLFVSIVAENGRRGGCWDVLAWKGGRLLFVESKQKKKDRMRAGQWAWREAALRTGLKRSAFLICEWSLSG